MHEFKLYQGISAVNSHVGTIGERRQNLERAGNRERLFSFINRLGVGLISSFFCLYCIRRVLVID